MALAQIKMSSKIGSLYLVASEKGLKGIYWEKQNIANPLKSNDKSALKVAKQAQEEILEYFSGKRQKFEVPLDLEGTEFQKKVWRELVKIPYGETRSYKDIATRLKDSQASRAVGNANGKNPVCIIVPCHRVIAADGSLGGYSGGLDKKKTLLKVEGVL
ncbi:MAG: methylated-DNA--[protein]-cysteine S-methyltransferase [Bdellovibrionales bacterium]|nr:methylated-DNA--[protein]-cysteine S-methyltransferase [Bdellovibrionales bacterium]